MMSGNSRQVAYLIDEYITTSLDMAGKMQEVVRVLENIIKSPKYIQTFTQEERILIGNALAGYKLASQVPVDVMQMLPIVGPGYTKAPTEEKLERVNKNLDALVNILHTNYVPDLFKGINTNPDATGVYFAACTWFALHFEHDITPLHQKLVSLVDDPKSGVKANFDVWLVTPFQRQPKIQLLFRDMIKQLPQEDGDNIRKLQECLAQLTKLGKVSNFLIAEKIAISHPDLLTLPKTIDLMTNVTPLHPSQHGPVNALLSTCEKNIAIILELAQKDVLKTDEGQKMAMAFSALQTASLSLLLIFIEQQAFHTEYFAKAQAAFRSYKESLVKLGYNVSEKSSFEAIAKAVTNGDMKTIEKGFEEMQIHEEEEDKANEEDKSTTITGPLSGHQYEGTKVKGFLTGREYTVPTFGLSSWLSGGKKEDKKPEGKGPDNKDGSKKTFG